MFVKNNARGLVISLLGLLSIGTFCVQAAEQARQVFPHKMPASKPDMPLSAAMQRMFDYPAPRVQDNELFSQFKYTRLKGFDYNGGDGTISRRDPSRPIFENGQYYIWYTKRHTKVPPIGWSNAHKATDTIPSTDWDLAEIWYATSKDGFTWQEQGVAVPRPPKPYPGHRSVATPDILKWKGKYYLYYQGFVEPSGLNGDFCPVTVSYADSPNGPWTPVNKIVVHSGQKGDWDQDQTHDPQPIVYNGKIYLYYKATYNKWPDHRTKYAVANGIAMADDPLGPFTKHPLNPISNSGHEATYFPYKEGIASIVNKDGNERSTIQYAPDGVNFTIQSVISLPPTAAAPFSPDAFTNAPYAKGITWGMSHFINAGTPPNRHSMLARFDCDLSLDVHDPVMKNSGVYLKPDVYFSQGLNSKQRKAIQQRNQAFAESQKQ
ncbi:glycoside hydrolase [Saccharobesus litoralis]|uniref:Glycoside hydrolase n=1 Tax=Saccharobesus litoralis TaxID=2172099 RepID=A0A2S0VXL5_9ALTE|nr:family 43 glycosylhydrolase [Saccharobesus litoralis]AWB68912.1 glycoside hydrolase [Saccharobesus litoralis]